MIQHLPHKKVVGAQILPALSFQNQLILHCTYLQKLPLKPQYNTKRIKRVPIQPWTLLFTLPQVSLMRRKLTAGLSSSFHTKSRWAILLSHPSMTRIHTFMQSMIHYTTTQSRLTQQRELACEILCFKAWQELNTRLIHVSEEARCKSAQLMFEILKTAQSGVWSIQTPWDEIHWR